MAAESHNHPRKAQEMATTFTMPELPGITFTVERGGLDPDGELNPSWIQITGTDGEGQIVSSIGFSGP
ncbi:Uncharacterised protein [Mycobacteroides abscessus subsp. abscessus]|nr:Uncharacterised protein [Mycobacteroides abscessus subsp. abscessus]